MSIATFNSALLLAPYYPCLWTLDKSPSVRARFDGGKWLCGLSELSATRGAGGPCVVYSLGSNYDTKFEDHVSSSTRGGCEFYIFDPTMGITGSPKRLAAWKSKLPRNYHFREVAITGDDSASARTVNFTSVYGGGARAYPASTLEAAMRANGHAAGTILKFDIDGFEIELLRTTPWAHLRFGLLLFEVHPVQRKAGGGQRPLTFKAVHEAFVGLERAGYRMYSVEPVFIGPNGQGAGAFEVAFVHRDWSPQQGFSAPCPDLPVPPDKITSALIGR